MKVLFGNIAHSVSVYETRQNQPQSTSVSMGNPVADTLDIQFAGRIQSNLTEKKAQQFVRKHARAIQKLALASAEASWASTCQGADYVAPGQTKTNQQREIEADQAYQNYFNNPDAFAEAQAIMDHKAKITNRLLLRQVEDLYDAFQDAGKTPALLELERKLMERTSELTGVYNNYRAVVDGQIVSNMEISQRLQQTNDAAEAKKLWMASSGHGQMVVSPGGSTLAEALVDLVRSRNEVARQNKDINGKPYSDYFAMKLDKASIDEELLVRLLDQMDEATQEPYKRYQATLNAESQERYGISSEEAELPWYGSGNLKRILQFDMQPYLKGKDPLQLLEKTANLMGDTVQGIFDKSIYVKHGETRSSIYFDPKKDDGKSQHWFSFGINPPDDVRTFGSVDPQHENMMDYAVETLLHESTGHGLDGTNVSKRLAYLLRGHHSVTTESHAMLLENLMQDAQWLEKVVGMPKAEAQEVADKAKTYNQAQTLSGVRWMVSLIQFECQMYKNPDQDLNKLWWDLQEKYMGTKRPPEGDLPTYARVPHFFSHPVYYQNYFLADLARAQKLEFINENFGSLLTEEAGDYLRTYRKAGNKFDWDDLVERMTGKALGVEALQKEFADFKLPEKS